MATAERSTGFEHLNLWYKTFHLIGACVFLWQSCLWRLKWDIFVMHLIETWLFFFMLHHLQIGTITFFSLLCSLCWRKYYTNMCFGNVLDFYVTNFFMTLPIKLQWALANFVSSYYKVSSGLYICYFWLPRSVLCWGFLLFIPCTASWVTENVRSGIHACSGEKTCTKFYVVADRFQVWRCAGLWCSFVSCWFWMSLLSLSPSFAIDR